MANFFILLTNTLVTVFLTIYVLNQFEIIQYDPIDHATLKLQQLVSYKHLDGSATAPPEAFMTTPEIIISKGYTLEVHHVKTADGYLLTLHRIPSKKKPVLLMHGIFASDFVFSAGPTNSSLAYILADAGYDVWLGNSRGNTYSRKHVTLDPEKEAYWDFSWDELGKYDIPAIVDYILEKNGEKKLSYVGYSLGCAVFFIGANLHPSLNEKIEVMIGLGPTATVTKLDNIFKLIAPFNTPLQYLLKLTKTGLFLPNDGIASRFLRYICNSTQTGNAFCQVLNFYVFGFSDQYNQSLVHTLIGHYPAGGSPKVVDQFFENYNSGGKFTRYNYGEAGNLKNYGTKNAPEYDMSKVTAPVYLVFGSSDGVATPADVEWLGAHLSNCKGSIRVPSPSFTHGDFFLSTKVADLVYKPLLKLLPAIN